MLTIKFRLLAGICFLLCLGGLVAAAQAPPNVTGVWDITMHGRQTIVRTLTLKQEDQKITGSIKGPAGEFPLLGTINGDKIAFSIDLVVQGRQIHRDYSGKVISKDTIEGTVKEGDNSTPFTAKPSAK